MFGGELGRIGARGSLRRSRDRGLPERGGLNANNSGDAFALTGSDRKIPQEQKEDEER